MSSDFIHEWCDEHCRRFEEVDGLAVCTVCTRMCEIAEGKMDADNILYLKTLNTKQLVAWLRKAPRMGCYAPQFPYGAYYSLQELKYVLEDRPHVSRGREERLKKLHERKYR